MPVRQFESYVTLDIDADAEMGVGVAVGGGAGASGGKSDRKAKDKGNKLSNGGGNGGGGGMVRGGRVGGDDEDGDDSGSAMDDGVDVFFDAEEGWVSVSSDADSDQDPKWGHPHHPHHHDEDDDDDDESQDNNSAAAGTNDDSTDGRDGVTDSHHRLANMSIDVSRTASTTSNIRYPTHAHQPTPTNQYTNPTVH